MVDPHGTDHQTIQGTDYTKIRPETVWRYGDAWYVKGAHLSVKTIDPALPHKERKMYNVDQKFPCDLIFVSGQMQIEVV